MRVVDNGKSIPVNISRNPCVKPYLTTYRRLQTDRPRNDTTKSYDDGTKIKEFRKFGKKKIGWLAIKPLSEVEVDQWKEHEKKRGNDTSAPIGGVARMRPGAGMIISYRTDAISKNKPCIALFQSNDAIEQYLRISEPPAHDNWNSGETRLNDPENFKDEDYEPGLGAKIVRTVNNRITNQLRDFQKDNPDPAPPPDYKLKQLESLLAKLMNAGNQGKPVPAGPPRPFSISVNSKRRKDEGEIKDEADIRITLNDDYPTETLDVEVDITRDLMGVRTTESSIEKLNCAVTDIASGQCYSGEFVTILATLKKNKPVKLKAVGAGWTFFKTRFQAVVRNTKTR